MPNNHKSQSPKISPSLMARVQYALEDLSAEAQDELVRLLELGAIIKIEQMSSQYESLRMGGKAK